MTQSRHIRADSLLTQKQWIEMIHLLKSIIAHIHPSWRPLLSQSTNVLLLLLNTSQCALLCISRKSNDSTNHQSRLSLQEYRESLSKEASLLSLKRSSLRLDLEL